jgi:DNA-binding transcriptional LysR family regulator
MRLNRLDDLHAFVAVVDKGSLTGAARHLGRSLQSVSRSLAVLERQIGVELIRRTTRRSTPTEAGVIFRRSLGDALIKIETAKLEAGNRRLDIVGPLRIAASSTFGPRYLVPLIAAFMDAHPGADVQLDLSNRFVDLVEERFDLAVRIGEMADSTLKSKRIGHARRVCFAAPKYFARHGRPRQPEDLMKHECIIRTSAREGNVWPFLINGKVRSIKVAGRFQTDGAQAANAAAVCGLGIGSAMLWQVNELIERGDVELALTRFEPPPMVIRAVWPSTKILPKKTRLFVDFLASRLRRERL